MTIRGNAPDFLPAVAALAVASCQPGPNAAEQPAGVAAGEDCLVVVWEREGRANAAFDRAHDRVSGGAISCATGASASRFDAALTTLRTAAVSGDRAAILRSVGLPLLYIDAAGRRRELTDAAAVDAAFTEVFSPPVIDLLGRVRLEDMEVVEGQGAFFELGALWLVVGRDGRPRVVTVNAQALGEAVAAARRKAATGSARLAPLADE